MSAGEAPSLETTERVLASSDHYRAARYARLLRELADDDGLASWKGARRVMAIDAELAADHAANLKRNQ